MALRWDERQVPVAAVDKKPALHALVYEKMKRDADG